MKKCLPVLVLCVCAVLLSCGKSGDKESVSAAPSATTSKKSGRSAVVLLHKAGLYVEKDNKMDYKTFAPIGETVGWLDDEKEAIRSSDGKLRDFAKIKYDKKEYWINRALIGSDAQPGVIIGDTTLMYTKADELTSLGKPIPALSIVAVHTGLEEDGFVPVSAYLENTDFVVVKERFIRTENVTTAPEDVRAMQLLTIINTEKNDLIKKDLLTSAKKLNSRFSNLIDEALTALEPQDASGSGDSQEFVEPSIEEETEGGPVEEDYVE